MTIRTPEQAIAWGMKQIDHPAEDYERECLRFVRLAFNVTTVVASAGKSWDQAKVKHVVKVADAATIPAGVPVHFELASEADHVGLSIGGGRMLGNDFKRTGRIDIDDIAAVYKKWGATRLGWTPEINGVTVYPGGKAAPSPAPQKPAATGLALRVDGVDLSHHNPPTGTYTQANFNAAQAAGVKLMWHKATEGSAAKYRDDKYLLRRSQAKVAGIAFGAYHFASPDSDQLDAVAEARAFITFADPKLGDLVPALDMETAGHAKLEKWSKQFMAEVLRLLLARGLQPATQLVHYGPDDYGADYPFLRWVPRYNDQNIPPAVRWDIRQFSNGAAGVPDQVAGFGHVDLNMLGRGISLDDLRLVAATVTAPKPAPKPTRKGLDFRVHLVPGNKKETVAQVKRDMAIVKTLTAGDSGIVVNTERESPALLKAVTDGLGKGWTRVLDTECTIAHGSAWHQAPGYKDPSTLLLAKDDPSMEGVSPPRKLAKEYIENDGLKGVAIGVFGGHLTSEANCIHIHVKGRKWREKTYKIQVGDVLDEVERVHKAGVPVVLAMDANTGKYFTGAQLFAQLNKRMPGMVLHAHNGTLDQVFLISTPKVSLTELGKEVLTNDDSDHDIASVLVHAEPR